MWNDISFVVLSSVAYAAIVVFAYRFGYHRGYYAHMVDAAIARDSAREKVRAWIQELQGPDKPEDGNE